MKFMTESQLSKRSKAWAHEFGLDKAGSTPSEIGSAALLVLDMENEFLSERGQMKVWGGPAIIPNVLRLCQAFRRRGMPVVFTRHVCLEPYKHKDTLQSMKGLDDLGQFLRDGSFGAKIHRSLAPRAGDFVITKYRYSAFYDTPLDTFLRVNQVNQLVITGVATNICCDSTARDAFYRGYSVFFPIDANGGLDDLTHRATLSTIRMSFGQLCRTQELDSLLRQEQVR